MLRAAAYSVPEASMLRFALPHPSRGAGSQAGLVTNHVYGWCMYPHTPIGLLRSQAGLVTNRVTTTNAILSQAGLLARHSDISLAIFTAREASRPAPLASCLLPRNPIHLSSLTPPFAP
jgi:hypothetical protein